MSLRQLYRKYAPNERRLLSGLLRLAAAVDAGPKQSHSDAAEALWRGLRGRDDRAAAACQRLFRELYMADEPFWLRPPKYEFVDERPGFYYVSAMISGVGVLVAGPWPTHLEALEAVDLVGNEARKRDWRAWCWGWGTARAEVEKEVKFTPADVGSWGRRTLPQSKVGSTRTRGRSACG